jgi:hypothetical protein
MMKNLFKTQRMGSNNTIKFRAALHDHFKKDAERMERLCAVDDDFSEIVTDFLYCAEELKKMDDQRDNSKRSEFEETLNALRTELEIYLRESSV